MRRNMPGVMALILASLSLAAEEEPDAPAKRPYPVSEEVVVTATRRRTDSFKAPYTVQSFTDADLRGRLVPRSMPDVFKSVAGGSAQKTSHGQGSPYLRGLTGYHTLFLVDGVRLNNATFRSGPNQYWNTVDFLTVERLEVVKGPSSVLYGSDAVGGTVNALTTRPWGGEGFHGRTFARFASAEDAIVSRQEFSYTAGPLGAVGGGSYKDLGDVDGGRHVGAQPNTGFLERDGDAKIVYALGAEASLTVAASRVTQDDVPRTHATVDGIRFRHTSPGTDIQRTLDQARDLVYARFESGDVEGFADRMLVTLSFHDQYERQNRVRGNQRVDDQAYRDTVYGASAQFEKATSWGVWTYGLEHYRDDVDSSGIQYNADGSVRNFDIQGQVGDEANYDLFGLYAQNEIEPEHSGLPVALIPGARYTAARAYADEVNVNGVSQNVRGDWENVSGSLRARWDAAEAVNVFGGVSQGFRAPNLSDLTRLDVARSGEQEVPSPGLDPEEFVQYEIGLKGRSARASGTLSYYYTDIRNFIDRVPTGNTVSGNREVIKKNTGDGFIEGIEFAGDVHPHPEWTLFGWAGWQMGAVDTFVTSDPASKERRPMSKMPPASATVGVRWAPAESAGRLWVEGLATMTRGQRRLSPADKLDNQRIPPEGTPGYTVYTLRLGRQIGAHVSATLAVENVTNVDYRVHGSGSNEPGTNLVLAAEARF